MEKAWASEGIAVLVVVEGNIVVMGMNGRVAAELALEGRSRQLQQLWEAIVKFASRPTCVKRS